MTRQAAAAAVTAVGAAMTTTATTVMFGPIALAIAGILVLLFGLFVINDSAPR